MDSASLSHLHGAPLLSPQTQIKDAKYWNSSIAFHTKQRNDRAILKSYSEMEALGFSPNNSTLPIVLKACARLKAVECGKKIHLNIRGTPLIHDLRVKTALIDFYCKCGFLEDANHLFDEMGDRDLVSWNAMISGYVGNFKYEDAIGLSFQMQRENLKPNAVTLVGLLSACAELSELRLGREIHCYCLRRGFYDSNPHIGTSLISFYSKFDVRVSRFVFDSMMVRNVVSWNAMISACFNAGEVYEAVNLFIRMLVDGIEPCFVSMLVTIQSCADLESLELSEQVHQYIIKCGLSSDIFVQNALINMYAKSGSLDSSVEIFENMHMRDVASWNGMLSAYKICGYYEKALSLFSRMQVEDMGGNVVTFATALLICSQCCSLEKAKALHAYIIKSGMEMDASIGNALLSAYADLNCVESSEKVLFEFIRFDVVSWNTMLSALICNKFVGHAWDLFGQMREFKIKPNSFTMVTLLASCEDDTSLHIGRSIHGYVVRHGLEMNSSLCTALTEMYMKCGCETTGRFLFENFNRDVVSWNSIIANYVSNGQSHEALLLYHQMHSELKPNLVTMLNVLSACANLANLPLGSCVHGYIVRKMPGSDLDASLENALITMYSKCGSIQNAEKIFRNLPVRDIISWNSMIAGYGIHGRGKDALHLFSQMLSEGFVPTSVTFVSVLSACSHSGLVEEGWKLFHSMSRDYDLTPEIVHYSCLVDLLARAGYLNEATSFIASMPIDPDPCVWRALLAACRVYSDIELATTVSEKLLKLEPMNIGNYILLSNIYAAGGNWDEVEKLRAQINEMGFRKNPGVSSVVLQNQVHTFMARDESHPELERIYTKLSFLTTDIMENGYVPDTSWALQDLED